jgi:AsmA protein
MLAVVLLVPVMLAAGALIFLDPNIWRPQIEAAAQRATGRTLRIGRLILVPSFSPTLAATDLSLANPPGLSRPDMATVARAEVKLALLPLLAGRVEIARLRLVHPDILLERDAAGQPNWHFDAGPDEAAPARASTKAGAAPAVLVRALRIEDGHLGWRGQDAPAGDAAPPLGFDLHVLEAAASGLDSPVTLSAQGAYAGQALAVVAETGPLARLLDRAAATLWPVKATLETPGARLAVTGTVTHPLDGAGYVLSVEGAAVNLSALDGLLAARLPPLRQVAVAARLADVGGRLPEVTGLAVRAGASDLDVLAPGLKLVHGELSATSLGDPVRAEAAGELRGTPLLVTASLGPLAALLPDPPASGRYPVELAAEAAGATLAVKGSIAAPTLLSGIDLAVTGRIADLSALSSLAGISLPALRPVTLDARVADRAGMPGLAVRGLAVIAPEADVSGELVVGLGARRSVQATLSARRIDLDAVLAALPPPVAASPVPAASPVVPPSPPPLQRRPPRLIPDDKLPFAALGAADADLHLSVGELRSGGASYRDLSGRLLLQDGRLALDPVAGAVPGGRLEFQLTVDSRATPPPVAVTLRAPGLSLKPLLAALHLHEDISGAAEIDADLRGTGDTPRALAAGLGGRLGVAMTDGDMDNRLLGSTLGVVLRGAQLPTEMLGLDRPGRTRIRCLALRADADAGIVTVSTVLLDTGRVLVHGAGTLNLRDEGIALRLRPMLRAGVPVVVPVRVSGTFLAPKIASDSGGTALATAGLAAGIAVMQATPFGVLAAVMANERGGDTCGPALAAARGGPRQAPPTAWPKLPNPAEFLRGLVPR